MTAEQNIFSRTERLLGNDVMQRIASARVIVFGVGGVGGYVVEALVRSGVGTIDLIDDDEPDFDDMEDLFHLLQHLYNLYTVNHLQFQIFPN